MRPGQRFGGPLLREVVCESSKPAKVRASFLLAIP